MNNQEVFTKVAKHLMTQYQKSRDDNRCLYRGPNDTSCAIGCLIPREIYSPYMEGVSIINLLSEGKFPQLNRLLDRVNTELLRNLQDIHDWDAVDQWESSLKKVASKWGLDSSQM